MIAALLEVHHHVEEGHLVPAPAGVQRLKVTRQDELVVFPGKQEKIYRFQFLNVSQPESIFKIQTIRLLTTDLLNHKYIYNLSLNIPFYILSTANSGPLQYNGQ